MVVISFKTPLILAFVAHNVACVTVKILPERPDESTGEKILEEFKIQVVHGGYFGKKTELPVRRELYGIQCLKKNEKFFVSLKNGNKKVYAFSFWVAFDSEGYNSYKSSGSFDKDVSGIVGGEFCVIWGTRTSPSSDPGQIIFYFNVYRNKADL